MRMCRGGAWRGAWGLMRWWRAMRGPGGRRLGSMFEGMKGVGGWRGGMVRW